MATILMAQWVSTLTPAMGALAASTLSYIDTAFIFPALFPADVPDAPKIGDVTGGQNSEGEPEFYAYGKKARVPGTIIWNAPVQSRSGDSYGKSGAKGTRSYDIDVAFAMCGNEIDSVEGVWMDGRQVLDQAIVNVTDGGADWYSTEHSVYYAKWTIDAEDVRTGLPSNQETNRATQFSSKYPLVITGHPVAGINGTYTDWHIHYHLGKWKLLPLRQPWPVAGHADCVMTQTFTPGWQSGLKSSVNYHLGTMTQTGDSIISGWETPSTVHYWRKVAYTVLEQLQLKNFGNRIPNTEFLVTHTDAQSGLSVVVADILERAGLSSSEYDVTGLKDESDVEYYIVDGYHFRGRQEMAKILQPLMMYYEIIVNEDVNGKLRFYRKEDLTQIAVTDFVSFDAPVKSEDPDESAIPGEITVQYSDSEKYWKQGAQKEHVHNFAGKGSASIDLSTIVMTSFEAREFARKMLYGNQYERIKLNFTLPPSYAHVQEGDVLTFDRWGVDWTVLVLQKHLGYSGEMRIEAQQYMLADHSWEE